METVQELGNRTRQANKTINKLTGELCNLLANTLTSTANQSLITYHRPDGNLDFISQLSRLLIEKSPQSLIVTSYGLKNEGGGIIVYGLEDDVKRVISILTARIPNIKGGGKGKRWQGKSLNWKELESVWKDINASGNPWSS